MKSETGKTGFGLKKYYYGSNAERERRVMKWPTFILYIVLGVLVVLIDMFKRA